LLKTIFSLGAAVLALFPALPVSASPQRCTTASFYGHGDIYHGRRTASGERFNGYGLSTAHRTLPFGTKLKVTNPKTKRSVIVRTTDRGPFVAGRDLDLSYGAFIKIARASQGIARVCYTILS
jgi:rare lipoprotein A